MEEIDLTSEVQRVASAQNRIVELEAEIVEVSNQTDTEVARLRSEISDQQDLISDGYSMIDLAVEKARNSS